MFFMLLFLCMPFVFWIVGAMFWAVLSHVMVWLVVASILLLIVWIVIRVMRR